DPSRRPLPPGIFILAIGSIVRWPSSIASRMITRSGSRLLRIEEGVIPARCQLRISRFTRPRSMSARRLADLLVEVHQRQLVAPHRRWLVGPPGAVRDRALLDACDQLLPGLRDSRAGRSAHRASGDGAADLAAPDLSLALTVEVLGDPLAITLAPDGR